MTTDKDKIVRIQADKLCGYLGFEAGTKIDKELLKEIATTNHGEHVIINRNEIVVTPRMRGLATIILEKIR